MSHTALRRVAIRLLHDPTLVDHLAAAPWEALADADLSDDERAWLRAVPAAAWRTDPGRPRRVLAALADEYGASLALAPERADAFFRSRHFHQAVQDRGSMGIAFRTAHGRRRRSARGRRRRAGARHGRRPARNPPDSSEPAGYASPCAGRPRDSRRSWCRRPACGAPCRHRPTVLGVGDEPLLVLRASDTLAVTIEHLEDGLAAVLEQATEGSPGRAGGRVVELGGDRREAAAIVDGLVTETILA
jgi:hypothetical protein